MGEFETLFKRMAGQAYGHLARQRRQLAGLPDDDGPPFEAVLAEALPQARPGDGCWLALVPAPGGAVPVSARACGELCLLLHVTDLELPRRHPPGWLFRRLLYRSGGLARWTLLEGGGRDAVAVAAVLPLAGLHPAGLKAAALQVAHEAAEFRAELAQNECWPTPGHGRPVRSLPSSLRCL